ncbi:hypothetical protein HWQ46_19510 [Shewanella sp. D64]|uniref:hypothetical protein n=1 Tax=unclassified Shewanella TaxID=196818 RepID=UPI0022BA1B28|nr:MULTISPECIES: hypothetical protein [unclassified Shewanella]MEC4727737.1 hypothetical protein [Shewanella sp. D64]MEC4737500.1 hypothetical protein [Shewanella sp. E94]WBJ97310.1 hypothetical protein HWQ47_09535 [Shewanella sp. MTB7]
MVKDFFKAFSKTASGSLLSMIFGALLVKILAVFSGTQGVGIFSLFRDFTKTLSLIFSLNANIAIVQGLSDDSLSTKETYYNNALKIIIVNLSVIGLILLLCMDSIKEYFFSDFNFISTSSLTFLLLAAVFGCFNVVFSAVLNANRSLGYMASSQVIGAFCGLLSAYPLINILPAQYAFVGVLLVINGSWLIANIYFLNRLGIKLQLHESLVTKVEKDNARRFTTLAFASLITGVAGMCTILFVRFKIEANYGISILGIFDAAWTLGTVYVVFILSSLNSFILPMFVSRSTSVEQSVHVNTTIKIVFLLFTPLIITMMTFSDELVLFFYTAEFAGSAEILELFLIGDVFKVVSWILGIKLLAANRSFAFIITSLIWDALFISAISILTDLGIVGIAYSYVLTQVIYFVILIFVSNRIFGFKMNFSSFFLMLLVFSLVLVSYSSPDFATQFIFYVIFCTIYLALFVYFLKFNRNWFSL